MKANALYLLKASSKTLSSHVILHCFCKLGSLLKIDVVKEILWKSSTYFATRIVAILLQPTNFILTPLYYDDFMVLRCVWRSLFSLVYIVFNQTHQIRFFFFKVDLITTLEYWREDFSILLLKWLYVEERYDYDCHCCTSLVVFLFRGKIWNNLSQEIEFCYNKWKYGTIRQLEN